MGEPREPYTVTEAAAWLRVSSSTIYAEVKANRLRAFKVGNRLRFRPEWLVAYAEANATGPEVGDVEGLRGGDGLPAGGWEVRGDVGASSTRGEAPSRDAGGNYGGRRMEADAGGAASRGAIELVVAPNDRKRGRLPGPVAS